MPDIDQTDGREVRSGRVRSWQCWAVSLFHLYIWTKQERKSKDLTDIDTHLVEARKDGKLNGAPKYWATEVMISGLAQIRKTKGAKQALKL